MAVNGKINSPHFLSHSAFVLNEFAFPLQPPYTKNNNNKKMNKKTIKNNRKITNTQIKDKKNNNKNNKRDLHTQNGNSHAPSTIGRKFSALN